MLHILWMILKCILILVGILLGILAAVILLLLFCPVRYRAELAKHTPDFSMMEGEACVSWLFHGIAFVIGRKEGKLWQEIRILGFPLDLQKKKEKKKEKSQEETKERTSVKPTPAEPISEEPLFPEQPEKQKTLSEEQQKNLEEPFQKEGEESHGFEKPQRKFSFRNKIQGFLEKLRGTFRKWTLTIQSIYAKIDWWKAFFSHERIQKAIRLSRTTLWKLLKHVFPTKIQGTLTFGSEDPSLTGAALAILGMTMPFHKNAIEIQPLFEGRNVLEGEVSFRGRVYGIVFVKAALAIYFNKDIKYTINRWKYKED